MKQDKYSYSEAGRMGMLETYLILDSTFQITTLFAKVRQARLSAITIPLS